MREYLLDAGLIFFGALGCVAAFWVLVHNSDRLLLRRMRPPFPFVQKLTHDETVAQRSLMLAFPALMGVVYWHYLRTRRRASLVWIGR